MPVNNIIAFHVVVYGKVAANYYDSFVGETIRDD